MQHIFTKIARFSCTFFKSAQNVPAGVFPAGTTSVILTIFPLCLVHGTGAALDDAAALEHIGDAAEENLYIIPERHMGGVLTIVAGFDVNRQLVASVDLR